MSLRRIASTLVLLALGAFGARALAAQPSSRIGDLTIRQGEVPRRLVGYGLVVGLDGTGDRTFGGLNGTTMTVRSVVNLLRRFNIEVPPDRMRLRNVAAVAVTAELSPYLRSGGRFEVQVGALGDATSLRGGVLWITPLMADPNEPPVATAQGPLVVATDGSGRISSRQGNAGRIADGGVVEVDLPTPVLGTNPRLALRQPDLRLAARITGVITAVYGDSAARTLDAGSVALNPGARSADSLISWLAALDTLAVEVVETPRIVIDGRDGTVVVGGDVRLGQATVSHRGITVRIGATPDSTAQPADPAVPGMVRADRGTSVQTLVAGLHAAGARAPEVAAIFEALRTAGALRAEVVIR
ncbi:MAG: flagellar basal body P-ring protein FlgI [Gemmatimonadales bacterium]